jgi:hypothetical protein
MANKNFVVQNGITVGDVTIFAGNSDIRTTGNITVTGTGTINVPSIGVSSIAINDSSIGINDTGPSSTIEFTLDNALAANINVSGINLPTGAAYRINQIDVLSYNTLKSGVVNSSLTSVGTLQNLTVSGNTAINNTLYGRGVYDNSNRVLTEVSTTSVLTSVGTLTALTVSGTVQPNANASVALGASGAYWNNFYAANGTFNQINIGAQGIVPTSNVVANLGSVSSWFNIFYGKATQAQYADLAENYQADAIYEPGTVLMFGGENEVTIADADTTAVAGIVSTNPAHLMNGALQGARVVALALQGRVPCRVIGPVAKGDILVSAGFGFAKTAPDRQLGMRFGQAIGKALENVASGTKATIEVVVGRV